MRKPKSEATTPDTDLTAEPTPEELADQPLAEESEPDVSRDLPAPAPLPSRPLPDVRQVLRTSARVVRADTEHAMAPARAEQRPLVPTRERALKEAERLENEAGFVNRAAELRRAVFELLRGHRRMPQDLREQLRTIQTQIAGVADMLGNARALRALVAEFDGLTPKHLAQHPNWARHWRARVSSAASVSPRSVYEEAARDFAALEPEIAKLQPSPPLEFATRTLKPAPAQQTTARPSVTPW